MPAPKKYMYDPSLQLTHEKQLFISRKAAAGEFPARKAGRSGDCLFLTRLSYTEANNLFLVPCSPCPPPRGGEGLLEPSAREGAPTECICAVTGLRTSVKSHSWEGVPEFTSQDCIRATAAGLCQHAEQLF